jgi:flavin-dependent dehydrogenase
LLDKILIDGAAAAGVEVREGFAVTDLIFEDNTVTGVRGSVSERARLVIGADGLHSHIAKAVHPEQYNEKPPLNAAYYSYWRDLPMEGRFETYIRPNRAFAAWPTNDDLTLVVFGWPFAEYPVIKHDPEHHIEEIVKLAPAFAERIRGAQRVEHLRGSFVHNFFRKPYGPGWALVGDAGYNKDYITAMGIQDAFRDAELCATAVEDAFTGKRSFDDAMRDYQLTRDQHVLPMFDLTTEFATLEPPPPELQQLFAAMHGNQIAMDGFARMMAGVTSPAEFFTDENLATILGHAMSGGQGGPHGVHADGSAPSGTPVG